MCTGCGREYRYRRNLVRHINLECGKEPRFQCPACPYAAKHKNHIQSHIATKHKDRGELYGLDTASLFG